MVENFSEAIDAAGFAICAPLCLAQCQSRISLCESIYRANTVDIRGARRRPFAFILLSLQTRNHWSAFHIRNAIAQACRLERGTLDRSIQPGSGKAKLVEQRRCCYRSRTRRHFDLRKGRRHRTRQRRVGWLPSIHRSNLYPRRWIQSRSNTSHAHLLPTRSQRGQRQHTSVRR